VTKVPGRGPGKSSGKTNIKGAVGRNALHTKVKTAAKRSLSSTLWLERQLNDPYVQASKRDGYRSRAAYKLLEIDEKFPILRKGARILDLGAAPGGWTQVALAKIGEKGAVLGVDILEMLPIPGARLMQLDFLDPNAPDLIKQALDGAPDIVMSDMAAPTTGHKRTDHLRTMSLCEVALELAEEVLAPGGAFLAKVLQGGTERSLLDRLKRGFTEVRHVKPKASRAESSEMYVLAKGFRGRASDTPDAET
jgi:23S rRNA (uridine2552-2'-O)-methyltransferase